jgi:lipopolysaccharide transport system ATP-binding protein
MQPLIELKDVCLQYKIKGNLFTKNKYYDALKNINLKIYPGEIIGIIGKNGSGKSSLLKILSGVIQPTSGEIINHGFSTSLLTIGAGFDNNLSGRDNAILSGMLQGLESQKIKSKLNEIHGYSELGDFFYESVRTYSTGMRARLGFSIANTINSDVILIDEILSVGDDSYKQKTRKTIEKKINSGQTIILVSHQINQIRNLCNKVCYINSDKKIVNGEKESVLSLYIDSQKA